MVSPIKDPTTNDILAAAIGVSRELERTRWWELQAAEARAYCEQAAARRGFDPQWQRRIATIAMQRVAAR